MDIVNIVAQTGGTLGLAVFAIWMLNRVWELRVSEAQRNAASEQQRADQMLQALRDNTQVITRLIEIVERLEKRGL